MFAYARYALTTPLSAEEVRERISRHTIHWRLGRFPLSDPDVPRDQLYFIGRVSGDSFRLQLYDDDSDNSSHAVSSGRLVAGPDGTRVEVRSGPAFVTWVMVVTLALCAVPCAALAVVALRMMGFGWEWVSTVGMGLVFAGAVPWALLKGRHESRRFRKELSALLRPAPRPSRQGDERHDRARMAGLRGADADAGAAG